MVVDNTAGFAEGAVANLTEQAAGKRCYTAGFDEEAAVVTADLRCNTAELHAAVGTIAVDNVAVLESG